MPTDDGGPAHPTTFEDWDGGFGGMSLLDWFAGQALTGMLACIASTGTFDCGDSHSVAGAAYDYAEAMLAEKRRWEDDQP